MERKKAGEINEGNLPGEKELSLYEKLLFQQYLFQFVGDYSDLKENACLDYQIEYLLFGEKTDSANLMKTADATLDGCGPYIGEKTADYRVVAIKTSLNEERFFLKKRVDD